MPISKITALMRLNTTAAANAKSRVRVMASLNGRQRQLLIDPNVDLAKEEVSLLPAPWIVPLTTPLGSREPSSAFTPANSSYSSSDPDPVPAHDVPLKNRKYGKTHESELRFHAVNTFPLNPVEIRSNSSHIREQAD